MKRAVLIGVILLSAQCLYAQDWAKERFDKSPLHHEMVTLQANGASIKALVVHPDTQDKVPVVVVIHDDAGLNSWAQLMADEIADAGYAAVEPDLLSSAGGSSAFTSEDKAAAALAKLTPDQITADLNAAADYALKLPESSGQLFVTGYGWGGTQSFRFAANRGDLSGAFVYYGAAPDKDTMSRIKAPVYAFYAGVDPLIDTTLDATKKNMADLGKTFQPVVYDASFHGFMLSGQQPGAKVTDAMAEHEAKERLEIMVKRESAKKN